MALEWLEEIERRANAATRGPWFLRDITFADSGDGDGKLEWEIVNDAGYPIFGPFWAWEDDAVFLRHSRTDVPRLCRAVREYAAANVSLTEAVDHLEDAVSAVLENARLDGLLGSEDDQCVARLEAALVKARLAVREARAAVERVERGDG